MRACESLERMGNDRIAFYQHRDNEKVPLADSLGAFDALARRARSAPRPLEFTAARVGDAMRAAADGADVAEPLNRGTISLARQV